MQLKKIIEKYKKNDPERKSMLKPEQVAKVILKAALIPAEKDVKELEINQ